MDRFQAYWRKNIEVITTLLVIWAAVSYGFAILFAKPLFNLTVGKLPLPFWDAQQGSIVVFVLMIFFYAWYMDRLDREHGVEE